MTGEGSDDIKSFPEFDQLDQIWGTRDFVNPKYVMEAGTSKSPNLTPSSTPAYSPSSSIADPSVSSGTSTALLGNNSDTETEFNENSPLSRGRPRGQKSNGKGLSRGKAKSDKAAKCDDGSTDDEELRFTESLFFKKKRKQPAANSKDGNNKKNRKRDRKEDEQGKEEDRTFTELMKSQVEAMKKAEEEKKQLFDYLRESDNRTQELVLGAIRELGSILKK